MSLVMLFVEKKDKTSFGLQEQLPRVKLSVVGNAHPRDHVEAMLMEKLTEEEVKALRELARDKKILAMIAENDRRISWAKALIKGFLLWVAMIGAAVVSFKQVFDVVTKGTIK